MINLLFKIFLYQYEVKDWDRKKELILSKINKNQFKYDDLNTFQTDRNCREYRYNLDFKNIFCDELDQFKKESNSSDIDITDIWTLKYNKIGENHCPHNHGSVGYSGLLYLEYDSKVHKPVKFVGPWNDPIHDKTQIVLLPDPKPGMIYIWPSSILHYVDSVSSNKLRMVTSWDMKVK